MKRKSRSELFLLELIIAILVFAISAAACTAVLAKAYTASEESSRLDFAVRTARSCTELMKAWQGDTEKCAEISGGKSDGSGFTVYYDREMNISHKENAAYTVSVSVGENCRFTVTVCCESGELYSIESAFVKEAER